MQCLLGCAALFAPRLVLVVVWLFSDFLGRAYQGWVWPLLGFLFLPLTTLTYAWAMNAQGSVSGVYLVAVVVAVLVDLGLVGGGSEAGRRGYARRRG
jgi:hypothetical protein